MEAYSKCWIFFFPLSEVILTCRSCQIHICPEAQFCFSLPTSATLTPCRSAAVTVSSPSRLWFLPRQSSTAGADPVSCRICGEAIGKLSCARASLHGPEWGGEGVLAQVVHKKNDNNSNKQKWMSSDWTYFPWETCKPWKMHL